MFDFDSMIILRVRTLTKFIRKELAAASYLLALVHDLKFWTPSSIVDCQLRQAFMVSLPAYYFFDLFLCLRWCPPCLHFLFLPRTHRLCFEQADYHQLSFHRGVVWCTPGQ